MTKTKQHKSKQTTNKQTNKNKEAYNISRNSRTVRRLSRKRRKGKALCNSIRTLRLRRVRKHGELLIMRDSLIEMVSQRANSVCVSRHFIMLCHADLRPNKLYVFEPIDRRSGFRRSKKKKKKKKAGRDVLVNEDMIRQWPPL